MAIAPIDEIIEDMNFLPDWQERYRYIIELGKTLEPLQEHMKTDDILVRGCISRIWLTYRKDTENRIILIADSEALIVRGLVAILFSLYSGKKPEEILAIDAEAVFSKMDLQNHISPNRRNGFASMIKTIRAIARRESDGQSS